MDAPADLLHVYFHNVRCVCDVRYRILVSISYVYFGLLDVYSSRSGSNAGAEFCQEYFWKASTLMLRRGLQDDINHLKPKLI
jgi:hypothetical protein